MPRKAEAATQLVGPPLTEANFGPMRLVGQFSNLPAALQIVLDGS